MAVTASSCSLVRFSTSTCSLAVQRSCLVSARSSSRSHSASSSTAGRLGLGASTSSRRHQSTWNHPNLPISKQGSVGQRYKGVHLHPGYYRGYPMPSNRRVQARRKLPNRRPKIHTGDWTLSQKSDGTMHWTPPYPPRINTCARPWPALEKQNVYSKNNPEFFPLKWKNVEYLAKWQLTRKPHGRTPYKMHVVTRVDHKNDKYKPVMPQRGAEAVNEHSLWKSKPLNTSDQVEGFHCARGLAWILTRVYFQGKKGRTTAKYNN